MIIDHLIMLFKAPFKPSSEVEEKQYTFYGRGKPAELEAYSVEISQGLAKRLVATKNLPEAGTEPENVVPAEEVDRIVQERLESEKSKWKQEAVKAKYAEKYHVEMLRRESELIIEKQAELLQDTQPTNGLSPDLVKVAQKIESEVVTCFRENQQTPLECLDKVRQMQVIARQLSLQ